MIITSWVKYYSDETHLNLLKYKKINQSNIRKKSILISNRQFYCYCLKIYRFKIIKNLINLKFTITIRAIKKQRRIKLFRKNKMMKISWLKKIKSLMKFYKIRKFLLMIKTLKNLISIYLVRYLIRRIIDKQELIYLEIY